MWQKTLDSLHSQHKLSGKTSMLLEAHCRALVHASMTIASGCEFTKVTYPPFTRHVQPVTSHMPKEPTQGTVIGEASTGQTRKLVDLGSDFPVPSSLQEDGGTWGPLRAPTICCCLGQIKDANCNSTLTNHHTNQPTGQNPATNQPTNRLTSGNRPSSKPRSLTPCNK